ncbi:MBL fold metallo-hydrolase [Mangrovibacterium sp.]|uniref:MBL fold metallo-hydrolase n=1 Tax=Mangrovibacterium sp. TaxID=1961364 RepID=UPI003569879A
MKRIQLIIGAILCISTQLQAERIYVNGSARGNNNGSSWPNAYTDLQKAIEKATPGDEIWVAKHTYYPTDGNDRTATFRLKENVSVYGGFNGTEKELVQRNWELNACILSGNIGDKTIKTDNSMHVVSTANNAVLDGFIVEDGYAMAERGAGRMGVGGEGRKGPEGGKPQTHTTPGSIAQSSNTNAGGGILNFKTCATIRNTVVRNCSAGKGGGVYNMTNTSERPDNNSPSPVFINVKFQGNYATMRGGAMQNDMGTNPVLINCEFTQNECGAKGGALYNDFTCSPILIGCVFENNKAHDAAAIGNDGSSSPIIVDTRIVNNVVESQGAGLYQGSYNANMRGRGNMPLVINSVVKNNHSTTNGLDNIINWGEDWIYSWNSEIEGFSHSIDKLDAKYAGLLEIAEKIKTQTAEDIDRLYTDKVKAYLNINTTPGSNGKGGRQGFGTDRKLSKTAEIPQHVVYVKSGSENGNGKSWENAFNSLQDAIDKAYTDGGGEVWVAAGTYKPTTKDTRSASFAMKSGVAVYGGFTGDEQNKAERNYERNKTILSGDIGWAGRMEDNSYHVVLGSLNSIIDGFTIAYGYADGKLIDRFGGGLYCWGNESSTIVKNTVFTNNYAEDGGAVFCFADVLSYFENVQFVKNKALLGGAAAFRFGSSCELQNCSFSANTASSRGGAMVINYGSNVIVNQSSFSNNETHGNGGAIWVDDQASQYGGTSPVITDCTFANNIAGFYGGAIHNYNVATTQIKDCLFNGNEAKYGNDIANTLRCQVSISGNKNPNTDIYDDNGGNGEPMVRATSQPNRTLTLDDVDFSVTIIGSGSPVYNPERSQPSALVQYKGTTILVDMGNGTKTQLEKLGLTGRNLPDALLLTHHHIDHNDEFISLVHDKLMTRNEFLVAGPSPIDEMTQYVAKFYAEDLNYRMSGAGRTFDENTINANVKVLEGGEQFEYKGIKISTIEVPHSIKTIAYRFDVDGQSIVITGDLTYTPDLQKLAEGADIMVIDGKVSTGRTSGTGTAKRNNSASSSVLAHASLADVAKMAVESNPKMMVLTHLGNQKADESATKESYAELGYKGEVVIAADFLTITPDGQRFMLQKQDTTGKSNQSKGWKSSGKDARSGIRNQSTNQQGTPMERFDRNGDNRISRDEAQGLMLENFEKIDLNGDGYISGDELLNRRKGR